MRTVNFRLIGRLPLATDIDDNPDADDRHGRQLAGVLSTEDVVEYHQHPSDDSVTDEEARAEYDPADDYDWVDDPEVPVSVDSETDIRPEVLRRLNTDRPSLDRDGDGDGRRGSGWKANTKAGGQWARHKRWEQRLRGDKVEKTFAFHAESLAFDLEYEREMLSLRRFLDRIEAAQRIADENARRKKQLAHQDELTSSDDGGDDEDFYELLQAG